MDFVTILSYLFGDGEETQQKLRSANCTTPKRLSALKPEKLSGITGLSLSHSECMINYAVKIVQNEGDSELIPEDTEETKGTAGSARTEVKLHPKDRAVASPEKRPRRAPKATGPSHPRARRPTSKPSPAPVSSVASGKRKPLSTRSVPHRDRARVKPETSPENVKSFWRFG